MKKVALIFALILFVTNAAFAKVTNGDLRKAVHITKKICRLSNKKLIEVNKIFSYYSDEYKSFDGYTKDETIETFKSAVDIYNDLKTMETIKKVEEKDGLIKVYIDDISTAAIPVFKNGASPALIYPLSQYAPGELKSDSSYALIFKKEKDGWKIISDEVFSETTEIRYGKAIEAEFEMEVPDEIEKGQEFTVKTTLNVPENHAAIGSIGHDEIVFPFEMSNPPARAINKSGVLERVMIANSKGVNEYASSMFLLINNRDIINHAFFGDKLTAAGLGIVVKRLNMNQGKSSL